ncbi:hypothetical protein [uncultured Mucilaginibacter sp.]|uniref:hypothetical protein n=1 Tax=uncultured Mucilaginibacter sp. TaxID=797541 RepID=UPI0026016654|nr:hypothetical protein [uncultured Mucilaginibacter sp.]
MTPVYKGILLLSGIFWCAASFAQFNDSTHYHTAFASTGSIIRSNTNLSLKIQKWLVFTTSFNYNRQNRTHSENVLLNYGLTIEKYF